RWPLMPNQLFGFGVGQLHPQAHECNNGYSGRASSWYFKRTTSTNACTPSRSRNSIQQWRTPWVSVPSRTACLMTRGKPLVAPISCSSSPDKTNVPLTPDCMGWRYPSLRPPTSYIHTHFHVVPRYTTCSVTCCRLRSSSRAFLNRCAARGGKSRTG